MRSTCMVLVALLVACGGDKINPDVSPDASPDAPMDALDPTGIVAARAAPDGTGLMLPIRRVTVTSVRGQFGAAGLDPAGFTIQAQHIGPALLVAVDPTALTPPLHVGDVVSFTITGMTVFTNPLFGPFRLSRASSLRDLTVVETGTDITPLVQDVPPDEAEIATLTGTVVSNPGRLYYTGEGFEEVQVDAALQSGLTLRIRFPFELRSGFDGAMGCHIAISNAPGVIHLFFGDAISSYYYIGVYDARDYTLTNCPVSRLAQQRDLQSRNADERDHRGQ